MPGIGNAIGIPFKKGGGISWSSYWNTQYDALFDTRSDVTITDSKNAETITVSHFPVLNIKKTSTFPPEVHTKKEITYTGGDITWMLIYNPTSDYASTNALRIQPFGGNQNYVTHHSNVKTFQFYIPTTVRGNFTVPDSANYLTNWYAVVFRYDTVSGVCAQRVYKMGASGSLSSANYTGAPGSITGSSMFYQPSPTGRFGNYTMFALWESKLEDAEIQAIVDTFTFPSTQPTILNNWNGDENYYRYFYNAIDGTRGHIGSSTDPRSAAYLCDDDYIRYSQYPWGKYQLVKGFTRRDSYDIPYKPDGTKGAADVGGDIEYPVTSVIHNMTNSYLNFSGITDATLKAIFDKSNRTYWKVSIESTSHYIDAGGGYYGLWHPTELLSDFIDTHAQSGHEGHIFASLRTSGAVTTGITSLRVFKINVPL